MKSFTMTVALVLGMATMSNAAYYTNYLGCGVGTLGSNTGDHLANTTVAGFDTTKGTLEKVIVKMETNFQIAGAVDSVTYPWSGTATSTSTVGVTYGTSETLGDSYSNYQFYSGLSSFQPYAFGGFNVNQCVSQVYRPGDPMFVDFALGLDTTFSGTYNNTAGSDIDIFFCNYVTFTTFYVTYVYCPDDTSNAVPEPTSIFLMGLGCCGFLFLRKSKDV